MKTSRYLGLLMIISGATLWGLSGPMIQWLFSHSDLTSINFLIVRLISAGSIILGYLFFSKKKIFMIWKDPRDWFQVILFAVIGMLGAQYAFIETINVSNAVTATLFQFFGPVLITIYVAIQNKKLPSTVQILAVCTALIGLFFLITNGSIENIVLSHRAIFFGVFTMLGFTFYTLHPASLIKKWGTLMIVGWGMFIGGIALLIFNQKFSIQLLAHTLTNYTFFIMILAISVGTISFLLYIGSLKYLSPTETSILSSIEPFVAAIVSMTWLNESFGVYQMVGGVFIIIAVIFLTMPKKREKLNKKIKMVS